MRNVQHRRIARQVPAAQSALDIARAEDRADQMHEARATLASQKGEQRPVAAQAPTSPFNFGDHPVRVLVRDGDPWFVCSDVAETLGYRDSHNAARHLDADEKGTQIVSTPGGEQKLTIINESGLYALVLRSRKPEARKFAKWVTSEVLPQIRKTGAYLPKEFTANPGDVLTKDQQDVLRQLVKSTAERLPKEKQGAASIKMWSKLKAHFGVSYREIPQQEYTEAVSLLTRAATEWELVDDEERHGINPAELMLSGQSDPVSMPDEIARAVDQRTWELTHEAFGLIHMHLRRRVAYCAWVGSRPEKYVDQELALEAIRRGTLGEALMHEAVTKMRNYVAYLDNGIGGMTDLREDLRRQLQALTSTQ